MKVTIQSRLLTALMPLQSEDTTRLVLNGINIESKNGTTLLVATDGRRMGVLKAGLSDGDGSFTINRNIISAIQFISEPDEELTIENLGEEITISGGDCRYERAHWTLKTMSYGNYPSWRKVIPKQFDEPQIPIDGSLALFSDWLAVAQKLKVKNEMCRVRNATNPDQKGAVLMVIRFDGFADFFGIQMNVKGITMEMVPAWLKEEGGAL